MALYVYKSGVHRNVSPVIAFDNANHNINHDTPTNPLIKDTGSTGATYVCAEIRNDNSSVTTMVNVTADLVPASAGTYTSYDENLEKTSGYRVKTFFNETQKGRQYNSINLATHDYFILLYADDPKQHHFAKITAEVTDDVEGDALEFQPKLGNEIPKGTKFSIFRGPAITDTSIVAVGAGLLVDSDTRHHTSLIAAKPLFYFYNDRLDKPNELDHNTKYKLCYANGTGTSSIPLSTISVFTTIQDYHFKIIDRSKYQLSAELIDNRKTMDDPSKDITDTNIYHDIGSISGQTTSHTNWNSWALNARRDINDDSSAFDFQGPIQYIHYEDSSNQLNRINNLYYSKIFNSIKDRAGIAECKFIDTKKIFVAKNTEGDSFTIRENIEELNLKDWHETELSLDSITSGSTNLKFRREGNYDARVLWGQHEEIKIGNYIGFVNTISAPSSDLHTVVCQSYWRLETDSTFTNQGSAPFTTSDKIYRRKWSPKTRTLMTTLNLDTDVTYTGLSALTDHPLDIDTLTYKINNVTLASYTESRFNNAFIIFLDKNYTRTTVPITFGDKVHSCFRLEPDRTHYRTVTTSKTNLDYAFGKCAIELELFDGTIEEITEELDNGQPIIEIVGRDNISKLVSPIINKNTLFTQDLIHSSMSPLTPKTRVNDSGGSAVTFTSNFEPDVTTFTLNAAPSGLAVGDLLFDSRNYFIGIVKQDPETTTPEIEFGCCVRLISGEQLFKQERKPYTFKKALRSSTKNSESVSSLEGASNKGLFFNSGISVTSAGVKNATLAGTSSNSTENATGYNFNKISNIKNDRAFQSLLKDDVSGNYFESDVVNGLSDFVVVSQKSEDKQTILELAPRVGLYLGRVDENDSYDSDNITITAALESDGSTKMCVSANISNSPKLTTTQENANGNFKRNDPVFLSVVSGSSEGEIRFLGYFIRAEADITADTHHIIYLDREITISNRSNSTSHEIHKLSAKQTTDMYFINKPASLIQLASPFVSDTWGLLPFNINIYDTASAITTDYVDRYGPAYYRFLDLEEGIYNAIDEYPIQNDQADENNSGVYYNVPSKVNFYALAHRFKPSYLSNTPVLTNSRTDDFTDLHARQGLFETRGNKPSRGTNFFDYYLTGNTDPKSRYMLNSLSSNFRTWERTLRQMDAKVSRSFLFTTCDLLPESDLRKTSLYYGSRDLTDFSILLQTEGTASEISQSHTKYLGGGSSISDNDDNNKLAQIYSAPSINNLKKFSMLRLVEMTLDWHFNSVDAENLPEKNKTIQVNIGNKMTDLFKITKSGGFTELDSYGSGTIVLDAAPTNLDNSHAYRFYSENGHYIGQSAAQTYGATISLNAGPYPNENNVKGALDCVYALRQDTAGYEFLFLRGHNDEDTFVNMPTDGEIHMLKGVVTQNDNEGKRTNMDGYAEDEADDFHIEFLPDNVQSPYVFTYSLLDLLNSGYRAFDIALPPTFRSNSATRTTMSGVFLVSSEYESGTNVWSISGDEVTINSFNTGHNALDFGLIEAGSGDGGTTTVGVEIKLGSNDYANIQFVKHGTTNVFDIDTTSITSSTSTRANYRIRNKQSDEENFLLLLTDDATGLTNNKQYHIWIKDGHYLGKTAANQTYGEKYLIMERCYFDAKLRDMLDVTGIAQRGIEYSLYPDESLINTDGNTHISEVIRAMAKNKKRVLFNETLAVFLDRFDIEDGGQSQISAGMTSSQIVEHAPLLTDTFWDETNWVDNSDSRAVTSDGFHKLMLRRRPKAGFSNYKGTTLKEVQDGSSPYIADGAFMLFKPYLVMTTAGGNNAHFGYTHPKATGGSTSNPKRYSFQIKNIDGTTAHNELTNAWLNYAPNLTGCYLVSVAGEEYGKDAVTRDAWYSSDTAHDYDTLKGVGETVPDSVHYIISHTITRTADHTAHEIVIDNTTDDDTSAHVTRAYKVMRVAEQTFYDFSPKTIKPYCLSPTYTKMAYTDSCYEDVKSYTFQNKRGSRYVTENRGNGSYIYSNTGYGEGVASMYVIADPSNKGSGTHLVYRHPSKCFGSLISHNDSFTAALFDGKNKLRTNIEVDYKSAYNTHELKFSNMGNMVGATSIGEIFTIKTTENIKGNYNTATIGCGVNICFESDDLLNDLFEDEGLEFEKQDVTEYPLFVSPEYKGVSLLSAADYILDRKDRRLIYDKKFILRDASSELNRPKVFINEDDSNYSVKSIKRGKKLFNVYNEIIVYGRNVKAIRKNLKSINKIGKKTLEEIDENLYTQYDAERKASSLLSLHSRMNNLIEMEVKGNNLFILKAGDVISIDFSSQNIVRNDYLIIEIEYTLDGFTKFKLGEYSKGLEDRFSELMMANTKLKGLVRAKTFKEPSKSNNLYDSFKIKEIRIKARLRGASGGATLGFATALNTSTTPIGFTGGATITYTDLFEEEL